ncbi:hypothetical protein [Streptomyces sp. NPDC090036]|uniref:hypothetical protein n=1 Tax=Streptomyces sp. NPDC090036 TaxID=3365926 RepID=UPI00380ED4B1
MRRSTPLARILGAAALLCAAVALGATQADRAGTTTGAARPDILLPLLAAGVLAAGWVLAVRAAPQVEPLPAAPARTAIPAVLAAVRRDPGHLAGALLLVWAPYAAAAAAHAGSGSAAGSLICLIAFFFAIGTSPYALRDLLGRQLGSAERLLREDAAAGRVHAVRVRIDRAVREDPPRPAATGIRAPRADASRRLELIPSTPDGAPPPVGFRPMSGSGFRTLTGDKHLAQAAAQLVGHEAWLCWPARWKLALAAPTDRRFPLPAALVTDSGHVVWGRTFEEDWDRYLRAGAAPEHPTDPGLTAVPLPRPARFVPRAHGRGLLALAAAFLTALPCLLGLVTLPVALFLAVSAGLLVLGAGLWISGSATRPDPRLWTVREETRP